MKKKAIHITLVIYRGTTQFNNSGPDLSQMNKNSYYSSVVLICSESKDFSVILLSFFIANWYFSKGQDEKKE